MTHLIKIALREDYSRKAIPSFKVFHQEKSIL